MADCGPGPGDSVAAWAPAVPARRAVCSGGVGGDRFPLCGRVPELVFAAVRPGFVAACMVEAAGTRGGRCTRASRSARPYPRRRTAGQGGRESRPPEPGGRRGGVPLSTGIARSDTASTETDKWNILLRLRQAFKGLFGATRLSLRESAPPPRTWQRLLWVTKPACRVIYLDFCDINGGSRCRKGA
jgi:hypothetical protein